MGAEAVWLSILVCISAPLYVSHAVLGTKSPDHLRICSLSFWLLMFLFLQCHGVKPSTLAMIGKCTTMELLSPPSFQLNQAKWKNIPRRLLETLFKLWFTRDFLCVFEEVVERYEVNHWGINTFLWMKAPPKVCPLLSNLLSCFCSLATQVRFDWVKGKAESLGIVPFHWSSGSSGEDSHPQENFLCSPLPNHYMDSMRARYLQILLKWVSLLPVTVTEYLRLGNLFRNKLFPSQF